MDGNIYIVFCISVSIQKMFPGQVNSFWRNMTNNRRIKIRNGISITGTNNILEISELIFSQAESKLNCCSADQDGNFLVGLKTMTGEIFGRFKMIDPGYEPPFLLLGQLGEKRKYWLIMLS